MATIAGKSFANYFVSIYDSVDLQHFSKLINKHFKMCVEQPNKYVQFTVYVFGIAVLLAIVKRAFIPKKKLKTGSNSYSDTFPYIRLIPYVNLQFLEGLIIWYKISTDGYNFVKSILGKNRPNCRVSIGTETVVVVSDLNIIQKLLGSDNIVHANKPQHIYNQLLTVALKDGLLSAKVSTWSHHRSALAPAFKYKSFSTYFKFINEEAKKLAETAGRIATQMSSGVISNQTMSNLIDQHAVEIVTQIIMGTEKLKFTDKQRINFQEIFSRLKKLTVERLQRPEQMVPVIWWFHPNRKEMDRLIKKSIEFVHQITDNYRIKRNINEEILKEKEQENELGIKPFECLVELMIKKGLRNKEIADEVLTILVAGHDTVKVALDLLIFHLAAHEEHQQKCRAEVDQMFDCSGRTPESDLDMDEFSKLKYLEMCILESMRLTPTVPAIVRQLQEPLKIDENHVFAAGELIVVPSCVVHRNPDLYPNPETYDPNRFLPENVKKRHPYAFIPFSMGMRNCIGWKIALLEIKVMIARILRNFEMFTTDKPEEVKLLFDVITKPERPYNVIYKKRYLQNELRD